MFFGGSPFEQFAGMHGDHGGGGGGRRGGPPADVDTTEFYQILGVEKDASDNDIKKAYRKLALKVREPLRAHGGVGVRAIAASPNASSRFLIYCVPKGVLVLLSLISFLHETRGF